MIDQLKKGLLAGAVASVTGGIPSWLALSPSELDAATRSIAHLVPGNARVTSMWGRRILGAGTHVAISVALASVYFCFVRRRPLMFAMAVWFINIKILEPEAMRSEDESLTFFDHLAWGATLSAAERIFDRVTRDPGDTRPG